MTVHSERPAYPSKRDAVKAARAMQKITKQLYRIWRCVRCDNQWHAAPIDDTCMTQGGRS